MIPVDGSAAPPRDAASADPTPLDTQMLTQEEQSRFPYHYLATHDGKRFSQFQHWSWGYRYLGRLQIVLDLLEEPLTTIWNGPRWRHFRRDRHPQCPCCPMALHTYLPLRCGSRGVTVVRWALQTARLDHLEDTLYRWGRQQVTRMRRHASAPASAARRPPETPAP